MSTMTIGGYSGRNNINLTASGDANNVHITGQNGMADIDVTVSGASSGDRHISGWVDQVALNMNHQGKTLFGTIGDGATVSISEDGAAGNQSFSGEIGNADVNGGVQGNNVHAFEGNDDFNVTTNGSIPGLDVLDYLIALTPVRGQG